MLVELGAGRDGEDLDRADLPATVAGLDAAMAELDPPPGQPGELATQSGLVALHGQHSARTDPNAGSIVRRR